MNTSCVGVFGGPWPYTIIGGVIVAIKPSAMAG
jgi:hypothetical protein